MPTHTLSTVRWTDLYLIVDARSYCKDLADPNGVDVERRLSKVLRLADRLPKDQFRFGTGRDCAWVWNCDVSPLLEPTLIASEQEPEGTQHRWRTDFDSGVYIQSVALWDVSTHSMCFLYGPGCCDEDDAHCLDLGSDSDVTDDGRLVNFWTNGLDYPCMDLASDNEALRKFVLALPNDGLDTRCALLEWNLHFQGTEGYEDRTVIVVGQLGFTLSTPARGDARLRMREARNILGRLHWVRVSDM